MIIEIDTLSPSPIYEQIREQIVLGVAAKRLARGEALPSVRRLAADLGINLHTVNKAYSILCEEGYVVIDRRKGALIAQDIKRDVKFETALSEKLVKAAAEAICHNLNENDFILLCEKCYREINC